MGPYENGYEIAYHLGVILKNTDRYKKVSAVNFVRRAVGAERLEQMNVWIRNLASSMTPAITVNINGMDGWTAVQAVMDEIDKYMEVHPDEYA